MHTSSFAIKTADNYFNEMLIPQYVDFLNHNASSRHALLATIVVYHFYEWVNGTEFGKDKEKSFISKYPEDESLITEFDAARLITNGTKHFSNKPVTTRTQSGFSSGFDEGFARPLNIQYPDGSESSVDKFLKNIVDFWKRQKELGAF